MPEYQVPSFHELTPVSELYGRISIAREYLSEMGLSGALVVQPADLFYFTGTLQSGHLLIPPKGEPLLMVRRDLDRARAESGLRDIVGLKRFGELPELVADRLGGAPRCLGLELDVLPVNFFKQYQRLWPEVEFEDISPAILAQRAVKSEYEIDRMRRSGLLARQVYARIPQLMKPGQSEIELAGLITREAYAGGHQNYLRMRSFDQVMYTWHVISGKSGGMRSYLDAAFGGYGLSPAFPLGASEKIMEAGESVLIDFGLCLAGYQVDLTRMYAFGEPPSPIRDAYQALARIEAGILSGLVPGATGDELFHLAVSRAEELGFGDAFLGTPNHKVRFVGHGVGLEINDFPILAAGFHDPLKENMTVALELKMVFPGVGAVGLENTFLVTGRIPENLSPANDELVIV